METVVQAPVHRHLVCWKSALAGLAISLITFAALVALGAAFGGIGLGGESGDGTTLKKLSFFAALSLCLATFLSVFAGAYFSVRVARTKVDLAGIAQGTLVGSLLLLLVLCQGVSAVGTMVKATGSLVGGVAAGAAAGAGAAAADPMVVDFFEDAAGDLKLRAEPGVVAKGVASRLLRGDTESAKNYLAYQAGITPEQADQRIAQAKAKADEALTKAREAAAAALKTAGWTIFLLIVLGLSAAAMGGLLATKTNERYFLDTSHEEVLRMRALHSKV